MNNKDKDWWLRPIPGFPKYSITRDGQVWSYYKNKFLKISRDKYFKVVLCKKSMKFTRRIHRLILEAYIGPCPEGMEACHNNGDKQDNRLSNLRWDTHKNNQKDKLKHGTDNKGSKHAMSKLTEYDVRLIRKFYHQGSTRKSIANFFDIGVSQTSAIINRKYWNHI